MDRLTTFLIFSVLCGLSQAQTAPHVREKRRIEDGEVEERLFDLESLRDEPVIEEKEYYQRWKEAHLDQKWQMWKKRNSIHYTYTKDEIYAYTSYKNNVKEIEAHQEAYRNGEISYTVELNKFAGKSPRMFASQNLQKGAAKLPKKIRFPPQERSATTTTTTTPPPRSLNGLEIFLNKYDIRSQRSLNGLEMFQNGYMQSQRRHKRQAPESFDWRSSDKVTPVKDQGECGACWAFTAVAAIESATLIKQGQSPTLSEQQLVDCAEDADGCDGGWVTDGFDFIQENNGIDEDGAYAYSGHQSECKPGQPSAGKFSSYSSGSEMSEAELMLAVSQQPVAAAMHMSQKLQFYSAGIFEEDNCPDKCTPKFCYLNHSVLIVGYGEDELGKYWIVKNSWGVGWGERGYMRLRRGPNMCGIMTSPTVIRI